MIHPNCPIVLLLGHISPEYISITQTSFSICWQVITTKCNTSIFLWGLTQEYTKHWLELIFTAELIDGSYLLHECVQVFLCTFGSQPNYTSKLILRNTACLVSLEYLHMFDARCSFSFFEANVCLSDLTVNITRTIAILNPTFLFVNLCGSFKFLHFITVLSAFRGKYVYYGASRVELNGYRLLRLAKEYFSSVLDVVNIFERHMRYCLSLFCGLFIKWFNWHISFFFNDF